MATIHKPVHSQRQLSNSSTAPTKRSGFTLIELLLVVSLIVLLIGMLLPALRKSKISSELLVCQTRQRIIGNALTSYGVSESGWYPNTKHSKGYFADAYELRRGHPYGGTTDRPPLGFGLLVPTGFLDGGGLGSIIHCPSFDNSNYQYAGHCMDVKTQWGYGGSGYIEYPQNRIIGSYTFRGTSYEGVNGRPPRVKNANDHFVTLIDVADQRFRGDNSVNNRHGGYNLTFGDGSIFHLIDETDEIEFMVKAAGGTMNGRHSRVNDEIIYGYMANQR